MIDVSEIVADADLQAPQPFTILRSTGQFVAGGFQSTTRELAAYGPVQRASSKEVQMLPEGDRVSAVMAFWWTQPIYVTTGKGRQATTHGEVPAGAVPGTMYALSAVPPGGAFNFYKNGLRQRLGVDYQFSGVTITTTLPTVVGDELFVTWTAVEQIGTSAADIIRYPGGDGGDQYRVLDVKHYPGSGYWKALATRMSAM